MSTDRDGAEHRAARYEKEVHDLTSQVNFLQEEVGLLQALEQGRDPDAEALVERGRAVLAEVAA